MLFTNKKLLMSALAASLLFTACKKDEDGDPAPPTLTISTTYDATNFATNTSSITTTTQLSSLTTEMKKGRTNGTSVTYSDLLTLFTSNNLKANTTTYYAGRVEGTDQWLDELAAASGGTYTPSATITGEGGTYGGYLFDENGIEIEQLVEKGLFGAALYNQAMGLLKNNMTLAELDQVLALFGATPKFANSNNSSIHGADADKFLANYAARRDKNDGNGLYTNIKTGFLIMQAALKAEGNDFTLEKTNAVALIKDNWEKANAATIINYLHTTIAKLSATNPTDADKASALHAYSEGVGFIHGFRTVSQSNKKITDAQIDEILVLMNAPYNGTPTSYKFVTDAANELPKLTQAIDKLQTIYGFSDAEIEDFKKNWVTEQGR